MRAVIGIDEVGRGCCAGPLLVVAARQHAALPPGLADSKALTATRRNGLISHIQIACDIGEGWVSPAEIDQLGLTAAMRLGVQRALAELNAAPDEQIIMDGHINYCDSVFSNVSCIVKADASEPIVSAASIYAKVTRDAYMATQARQYPDYGFETHVGYGTKAHQQALATHGVTELHRKSYKPIQAYL